MLESDDAQQPLDQKLQSARLVTDLIGAALAFLTWASLSLVVVILLWRTDWSHMDDYSKGMWLIAIVMNVAITAIAAVTTLIAFAALASLAIAVRDELLLHKSWWVILPTAFLGNVILWSLLFFTLLLVAVLAIPLAESLNILQKTP